MKRDFRHIGYVVEGLPQAINSFKRLFDLQDSNFLVFPPYDQPADTCFAFFTEGGATFELIHPISEHFKNILFASGKGINHICFTVDNIEEAVKDMQEKGARPGHVTPKGIIQMPSQKMIYFDPETTGGFLIEFIEPAKK